MSPWFFLFCFSYIISYPRVPNWHSVSHKYSARCAYTRILYWRTLVVDHHLGIVSCCQIQSSIFKEKENKGSTPTKMNPTVWSNNLYSSKDSKDFQRIAHMEDITPFYKHKNHRNPCYLTFDISLVNYTIWPGVHFI